MAMGDIAYGFAVWQHRYAVVDTTNSQSLYRYRPGGGTDGYSFPNRTPLPGDYTAVAGVSDRIDFRHREYQMASHQPITQ